MDTANLTELLRSMSVQAADYGFSSGDLVQGGSSGGTWYGRVIDRTKEGEFSDRITTGSGDDADQSISGSEDNPAYLIQILQENNSDDGPDWVEGDAVVAHRQDSVMSWSPDGSVAEALHASVATGLSARTDGSDGGLTGVVWGAGTHTLHVNGSPTEVYVPPDTVPETFTHVQESVEAGNPPGIGVDHFDGLAADNVPVAADTGLLEIGEATSFQLSEDGEQIVMTDSDLTNPQAQQVAASGGFEGLDYSIVGDILLATGADGDPRTTDSGALKVDTVRIQRVDVVQDGAVQSAGVGNVPALAARIAARSPATDAQFCTKTLRAAANTTTPDMDGFNPGDFSDGSDALEAAADLIEQKDNRIQELEAKIEQQKTRADAFDQIAAAVGLDPTSDDVAAQDVVDAQTADLRAEIADMEASLPGHSVSDVDTRADELTGKTPDELKALRGERATEILRTEAEYDARNTAVPAGTGRTEPTGGQRQNGSDGEQLAQEVMHGQDVVESRATDQSPAAFIQAKYGVDPGEYSTESDLRAAISDRGDA